MAKKLFWSTTLLLAILCGSSLLLLYSYQENLIFSGEKLPEQYQFEFSTPFTERLFDVKGVRINALHFRQENPRALIFYLHGNTGNVKLWTKNVNFYQRNNYDFFILDYRGYGKSTGKITSQEQFFDDVETVWNAIESEYEDTPIVIFGRSLGTWPATKLAAKISPDLLILVSPFFSLERLIQENYPLVS